MRAVLIALATSMVALLRSRASLHLEILALRHQLAVLQGRGRRPRLEPANRLLWVWLSRAWSGWQDAPVFVKPITVISADRTSKLGICARSGYGRYVKRLRRIPGRDKYTRQLKDANATVIHVVSSLRTALKAEAAGVDAVVAEGIESGGKVSREEIPTISLVPQVVDAVKIPVIAAGGLADGRGLLAALALGAQGIQLGARFLATVESPAHDNWKKVLVNAGDADTAVTCRQSSPTRLIRNDFWDEMNALDLPEKGPMEFMKIQGEGMAHIPTDLDGTKGNYTAGTGAGLIREVVTADEVVCEIMREAEAGLSRMNSVAS